MPLLYGVSVMACDCCVLNTAPTSMYAQLLTKFEDYVDEHNVANGGAVVGYDGFHANASVRDLLNSLCKEVRAVLSQLELREQTTRFFLLVSARVCCFTSATRFLLFSIGLSTPKKCWLFLCCCSCSSFSLTNASNKRK